MTGYKVPIDAVRNAHGPLNVDAFTNLRISKGRCFESFRGHIDLKAPGFNFYHSQTSPAGGDAISDFCLIQLKISINYQALAPTG